MKSIFRLLFLVSVVSYSQVGGETVYNFLNVPTSAHQAALGGKAITLVNDINQPLWNPATINDEFDNQVGVNYLNYLVDINYLSATYAYTIDRQKGTVHGGITYVNYGEFIEADENGIEIGTFKAYDMVLQVGYAYKFLHTSFTVGANLKLVNSVIQDYSSFGILADLGVYYANDKKPYTFALVARNIGSQITTYDDEREKVPFEIILGGSYKLENVPIKWHVSVDNLQQWNIAKPNPSNTISDINGNETEEEIGVFDNAMRHVVIGAELFPDKGFNLRVGYNIRRSKELQLSDVRTFAGFSAGFGLKMNRIKLNYAYTKYHPAENTSTFSLVINLNK